MLDHVVSDLACALCGAAVSRDGGVVRCATGHSFDVARQGYVGMLSGGRHASGDDAAMVAARERFLGGGHYERVAETVTAAAVEAAGPGCVVDAGAGTGYYLARLLDALPDRGGVALDASAAALRRAARCHERAGAVACDVWAALPVRTGAAGVVLNVFAPRNGAEIRRALHPSGALVVATPTERHLVELVAELGLLHVDEEKERRVDDALGPWFDAAAETVVEHSMRLDHPVLADLVAMGPSARHVAPDVGHLPEPFEVTCSVRVSTYVPCP